ncbi:helix-turn-helix domain-containing protein [Streptomyces kaniharaensis]|uniref:Helix-turn-helix domain-containing protein n=1 Tax=Streptomyces kaniharaensis TaxID=212423 RepID=A0A6N7L4P6_9ACTN|nr:helix-turn-helix domain-containing protein [Streptomyces kaniharaensis]MQS17628.1 helix-turn-helix domain-containing protein [Streptomyces kaniharaensis]
MSTQPDTPDAIDALLGQGPRRAVQLPTPAERERLRTEYGLTKAATAKALGVSTSTFTAWESGQRDPQGEARAAYARLLEGIAAQLRPEPAAVTPPQPQTPAPAPAEAPVPVPMLDQQPDGSLVMAEAAPCVQCGNPSVYRSQGVPIHLGGFCRPGTQPPEAPVAPQPAPASAAPAVAAPRRTAPHAAGAPSSRQASPRVHRAPVKATATARPQVAASPAAPAKYPAGPLAVIDLAPSGRALLGHLVDGRVLDVPAMTLPQLTEWAVSAGLGQPRLHKHGKDSDPLVVLMADAAEFLGLPPMGEDADGDFERGIGRLPETGPVVKALVKAGWQLTQRGFGPWARVFRTPDGGKRVCVQYCIPMWSALASAGWKVPADLDAVQLAALLGGYAERVQTPRGSTAVTGLQLMEALRPPTRAVRTETGWTSGPVEGSRTHAFDPAPPEPPAEHPLAQGRAPGDVLMTETWDWIRDLDLIEDRERGYPYVIGLDVNMAYLAAAGRLTMALSEPVHKLEPVFDKRIPGSWKCDFSNAELDPRLPNPFTPDGLPPTGPAWYSTVKVAYALELGIRVQPTEGWLRHESGPWLDPWHKHLREAYLTTMANLGVPLDLADRDVEAFLAAMANLKNGNPVELAILHAIKSTAKGGIGKLRERPRGATYRPGQRWPALDRPTWDPLNRALVIDTDTVNKHRKIRRHAEATGEYPIAALADCIVYPSKGPSPLDVLLQPDGTLATAWRLGISPGHVKHEGTQTMTWALEMITDDVNPGRHIKGGDAYAEGE